MTNSATGVEHTVSALECIGVPWLRIEPVSGLLLNCPNQTLSEERIQPDSKSQWHHYLAIWSGHVFSIWVLHLGWWWDVSHGAVWEFNVMMHHTAPDASTAITMSLLWALWGISNPRIPPAFFPPTFTLIARRFRSLFFFNLLPQEICW